MACRACVKLLIYVDEIDATINTQTMKNPHYLLVYFAVLYNERKPGIVTFKKDKRNIFSKYCTEIFKEKIVRYVNEVLFKLLKTILKDTYPGWTTPIAF